MNMLPSSTSSSSQGSMGPSGTNSGGGGLMRYGSAPSSLLTTAVDSVIGSNRELFSAFAPQSQLASARFFPSEASESAAPKPNVNDNFSRVENPTIDEPTKAKTAIGLQRSYGFTGGVSSSSSLVRHSSSPAGFLNHLASAAADNGFSITRGIGSSYNSKGIAENVSRLNSQLSFTRPKEALSRISEETENVGDSDNVKRRSSNHSNNTTACFEMGLWDDQDNPLTFSVAPSKQPKTTISTHVVNCPDTMESQFQFGMPQAAIELTTMDKLLHIPQDSVPCKIRAKRGFATHPRSIAERERRTRISGKLKKLQDLVPNMDKQTSYADMLDLAVQHIKTLQNQIQKLNNEVDSCTCGCKKTTDS